MIMSLCVVDVLATKQVQFARRSDFSPSECRSLPHIGRNKAIDAEGAFRGRNNCTHSYARNACRRLSLRHEIAGSPIRPAIAPITTMATPMPDATIQEGDARPEPGCGAANDAPREIGRASWWDRVCQDG